MIVYASSMLQNAPKSTAEKALRGTSGKDARFPQQRSKKNKRIDSAKKNKNKKTPGKDTAKERKIHPKRGE